MEVLYQGKWGTVCDDHFDMFDAQVACKMIAKQSNDKMIVKALKKFGEGSGKIWLDDLRCTGDEDTLFDCTHPGIGVENCAHSEDVGVVCKGRRNTFNSSFINNIEIEYE